MRHEVKLKLNTKLVGTRDVKIEVREARKLGTLLISRGNIQWLPVRKSKMKYQYKWDQFAEVMKLGKRIK